MVALAMFCLPGTATATFVVNLPWARPLPRGSGLQVFMNVASTDAVTLVAAHGPPGTRVVLRDGRGRPLSALALPPGETMALAPGRVHLVLRGLPRRAAGGSYVPIVLTLADRTGAFQDVAFRAEVRRRSVLEEEGPGHTHAPH